MVVVLGDDSLRRDKSKKLITTTVAQQLPSHEQFELGAFAMQNGLSMIKRKDSCGVASGRLFVHFDDESSQIHLLPIESYRSE